jgi:formylglycine-generating enzyme required for sulfatase activity
LETGAPRRGGAHRGGASKGSWDGGSIGLANKCGIINYYHGGGDVKNLLVVAFSILIALVLVSGCGRGGADSPITSVEQNTSGLAKMGIEQETTGLIEPGAEQNTSGLIKTGTEQRSNRAFLGFWQFNISADRQDISITPARTAEFHVNLVNLLESKSFLKCLKLGNFMFTPDKRLYVDVTLTHPFPDLNKYCGFDVRGIMMTGSDYTFPSGRKLSWTGEHIRMIGPDGYTSLFNPVEFPEKSSKIPLFKYTQGKLAMDDDLTSTLNPFMCYGKENDRNIFMPGDTETVTMLLKLVDGPLQFGYAVDASWVPVDGDITDPVKDYPISANATEANAIYVSIGKGLTPTGAKQANVIVEVNDWQGIDTVDKVTIEAPEIFSGEVEAALSSSTGEYGIFNVKIQNSLNAPIGDYPLLVTVKDKYNDENLGPIQAYQVATAHVTLTGVWLRELILIPSGDFIMGSDSAVDPQSTEIEVPQHIHPTGQYYIGKYELTCEEYAGFIADAGYDNPEYWSPEGWAFRVEQDIDQPGSWNAPLFQSYAGTRFPDYPITHISWFEAQAFCNWAGGRLPGEAEWEKASRGTDGRIFPWGNEWDPKKCNHRYFQDNMHPMPVGFFSPEGDSPYGLADAVGNADEWINDWYDLWIYAQYADGNFSPPTGPNPYLDFKGLRGGKWGSPYSSGYLRCADRNGCDDDTLVGGFRITFDY